MLFMKTAKMRGSKKKNPSSSFLHFGTLNIHLLLLELETMRRVQEIDSQLFLLVQADYDAARISPQQFLPKQKAFLEGELGVMRKEMEVAGLEREMLNFTHFAR